MTDRQSVDLNLGSAAASYALTDNDRSIFEASTNRGEVNGQGGAGQGVFNVGILILGSTGPGGREGRGRGGRGGTI